MNFNFPHITLNLANPEKSDLKFHVNKYPDGQSDIVLETKNKFGVDLKKIKTPIIIKSRFNSVEDLNIIKCATACLKRLKVQEINLYIPYLLGARADRKFVDGGCSYLVDIISTDLNALNFESITVLDVHSDVSSAVISNIENISVLPILTQYALEKTNENDSVKTYIISPDAGASKRTFETAKNIVGYDFSIVECSKHRDLATGKILETLVPKHDFEKSDCIIVDDLIDGGRTFIELAKIIKNKNCGDIYLCATHGIFSSGTDVFKNYFKKIFTTNSYKVLNDDFVFQLEVFNS